MGPCPFMHGYCPLLRRRVQHPLASMGPCPFRHGYAVLALIADWAETGLQWGHALSGMDTLRRAGSVTPRPTLQWGHALSGMDTMLPCRHGPNAQWASMGPCPFRHGYVTIQALDIFSRVVLQWGHALSGMDILPQIRPPDSRSAASMGPCPFRHGYGARSKDH